MWQSLLLELGIQIIKSYIKSTNTQSDDKVLSVIQDGAKYLSKQENNNLTADIAIALDDVKCDWG